MSKYFFILSLIIFSFISSVSAQYRTNYLDMGRNAIAEKNYTEAIQYLNNYIQTFPTRYDGYYLRSIAKYYLEDLAGAEKDLNQAIDSWSRNPDAYFLRGVVRSGRLEYEDALNDYAKAIKLDSAYTDAYFNRALTYYDMHNYAKSLEDCNQVINLDLDYRNIDILHGLILARQRKFNEAIIDFCRSIDKYPMNVTAYVERGAAYMQVDKTALAMQDFAKALRIDSLSTYAYFQRGLAYMQLGNYQQALKDFNYILKISPDNQLAWFNRAIISSNTNDETKAVNDFLNILRKNPDNMLVYYNLGVTLSKLGRYELAIGSFDKAISLFPDYTDAYYARARAKLAIGDKSGAYKDKTQADRLQKKNQEKSDSTKYKEGLQILKLTHLSANFSDSKDAASEDMQKKPDVKLSSFYNILLNPGPGTRIDGAYDCFGKPHYSFKSIALSKNGSLPDISNSALDNRLPDSLKDTKDKSKSILLRKGLFNAASG
ncbi:MAG TPA: tetratricopeptide repeat protein, partial [Bacteroidales bacterium]|nr:tetratricopeptide repeat protein [Bacteroidales bacterium]